MSLASLEYARQTREERYDARHGLEEQDYDVIHISLPGSAFTLWVSPIFTYRLGPTEFCRFGMEGIRVQDARGHTYITEFRDGSFMASGGGIYWPTERIERHNLGGRLSS